MKLLQSDFKKPIKVKAENLDDLWVLSQIIEARDVLGGHTERKIKLGGASDRSQKVIKKHVFIILSVEKTDFSKGSSQLRVSGKIQNDLEDIPKGSYHTIDVEEGSTITIQKEEWLDFQKKKLKEASKEKESRIMVCIFDREEAHFAMLKRYGYEHLLSISGDVQKKAVDEKISKNFYEEIIKQLQEYDKRYELERIILASPSFWKEELMKNLKDDALKKKIISATCSSCDKGAINEVLKRPEVKEALKEERAASEIEIVERILTEIKKNGAVAYGIDEVQKTAEMGAIDTLAVTDNFIQKKREENSFARTERIMKTVDKAKGTVTIISSEHEGGKKLDGLGGIAALLRYRLSYE